MMNIKARRNSSGAVFAKRAMASACVLFLASCGGLPGFSSMPSLSSFGVEAAEADADSTEAGQRAANLVKLEQSGPLGDRSIGSANAPVTIIEYVSLTCPNCAKFQSAAVPQIKKAYIDAGKVRLIVREYPIGPMALAAAIAVRCIPEKAATRLSRSSCFTRKTGKRRRSIGTNSTTPLNFPD